MSQKTGFARLKNTMNTMKQLESSSLYSFWQQCPQWWCSVDFFMIFNKVGSLHLKESMPQFHITSFFLPPFLVKLNPSGSPIFFFLQRLSEHCGKTHSLIPSENQFVEDSVGKWSHDSRSCLLQFSSKHDFSIQIIQVSVLGTSI